MKLFTVFLALLSLNLKAEPSDFKSLKNGINLGNTSYKLDYKNARQEVIDLETSTDFIHIDTCKINLKHKLFSVNRVSSKFDSKYSYSLDFNPITIRRSIEKTYSKQMNLYNVRFPIDREKERLWVRVFFKKDLNAQVFISSLRSYQKYCQSKNPVKVISFNEDKLNRANDIAKSKIPKGDFSNIVKAFCDKSGKKTNLTYTNENFKDTHLSNYFDELSKKYDISREELVQFYYYIVSLNTSSSRGDKINSLCSGLDGSNFIGKLLQSKNKELLSFFYNSLDNNYIDINRKLKTYRRKSRANRNSNELNLTDYIFINDLIDYNKDHVARLRFDYGSSFTCELERKCTYNEDTYELKQNIFGVDSE